MKKTLVIILLCLSTAAYAQTAKQYYDKALKATDINEQIKLYTKTIEKSPKFTSAYHRRGDAYKEQGKLKKAITDYTKAINLSKKDAFKYYARGLAYFEQGNYPAAADDFTVAIKLKNNYDDFFYNRALSYMKLEKYNQALKDLDKIKNKKNNPDIAIMQGKANFFIYNYAEATKLFQQILDQNPDDTQALFYIGRINFNNEMYDEAISYFSKVINRDSAFDAAYRLRASAFKEIGQYPQAAADYTMLIALSPDYGYYNRRGLIYEEMDDWRAAAEDYSYAIAINPKWAIPYNNRGYAYLKMKDYKRAKKDFETSIKLSPSLPTTHINMAGYYWSAKKDKKNMYKYLDSALKHNFKDLDSLYEDTQKGWLFKNINNTVEFRSFISNYTK